MRLRPSHTRSVCALCLYDLAVRGANSLVARQLQARAVVTGGLPLPRAATVHVCLSVYTCGACIHAACGGHSRLLGAGNAATVHTSAGSVHVCLSTPHSRPSWGLCRQTETLASGPLDASEPVTHIAQKQHQVPRQYVCVKQYVQYVHEAGSHYDGAMPCNEGVCVCEGVNAATYLNLIA